MVEFTKNTALNDAQLFNADEMAKIALTYQGLFPGIESFRYGYRVREVNPDPVQFFTSFITQYQEKILKFPTLDAGNGTFVLPFGCNWNRAEVHCVFVTENFFSFVLQLAQLGNRPLKKPNEIFSSELLKLIGDLA
ncbi:unnamed protein product [Cylicocyclus nassatus]|uniref:Uncharacterized protein n=1 Tax=Cylicocyclus nassatus TaxID=53992 RepID=A0AA36DPW1_CYLNA|nr:unnamed protein product [Cylicocyclus nassatus]